MIATRHVDAGGLRVRVAEAGRGPPIVLLHGWPEFSLTWEPVMDRLADRFRLIAPDLRGFGGTDRPPGPPADAARHAADVVALLDALGLDRVGLVAHDVGGAVAQVLGREHADRLRGMVLFGFAYPGIGARTAAPSHLIEIWYQSFHRLPLAAELVGASRDTVRTYIGHFLRHWAHRKDAFDPVLERFVDEYREPGRLQGGFDWYEAAAPSRIAMMEGRAPALPPITVPTCVRWPAHDPLFPYGWTDRLGETFANLDLAPFEGVGHFPHREDPDRAAALIGRCFA